MYKQFPDDGTYDISIVNKGIQSFNQRQQVRVNAQIPIVVLKQIKTAYLIKEEEGEALLSHTIEVLEQTNDFESEIADHSIANTIWNENCRHPLERETKKYWQSIGAASMGGKKSAESRNTQ